MSAESGSKIITVKGQENHTQREDQRITVPYRNTDMNISDIVTSLLGKVTEW